MFTPSLQVDNMGAIQLAKNPVHHERSKHIDIKHHFVREQVENKTLEIEYVNTKDNLADIFTKTTLTQRQFEDARDNVMGKMPDEPARRETS